MESEFIENMDKEKQLMIRGMDMLLKKFNILPDDTTVTVAEIISVSNSVYDEIMMDDVKCK